MGARVCLCKLSFVPESSDDSVAPDPVQFATIFSTYSNFLKSNVLNGEAFRSPSPVFAGTWVGGMGHRDHGAGHCGNTKAKGVRRPYPHP